MKDPFSYYKFRLESILMDDNAEDGRIDNADNTGYGRINH